jgi:hypothetical protein
MAAPQVASGAIVLDEYHGGIRADRKLTGQTVMRVLVAQYPPTSMETEAHRDV